MAMKRIDTYSNQYKVSGCILAGDQDAALRYVYRGQVIILDIEGAQLSEEEYKNIGEQMMDEYISHHFKEEDNKVRLHYWYLEERKTEEGTFKILRGSVSGHPYISDSEFIHTSNVLKFEINSDEEELVAQTRNTIYHCPLSYLNYDKQDKMDKDGTLIPDYESIKEQYKDKIENPTIEPGKVLFVISNFDDYYFHSLYYRKNEHEKPVSYTKQPQAGSWKDSFYVRSDDCKIDLRYFLHYKYIEFYVEVTDDAPLYVENIGSTTLYCQTQYGVIKLEAKERKQVCKENVEEHHVALAGGDLYPAVFWMDLMLMKSLAR